VRDGLTIIEVADRGPGLPEESVQLLTGPIRKSLPKGSGLGLWVVRQIVEEIGATLDLAARPGGGSVITITLGSDAMKEVNHAA
jgi:signal transduction histidine kinase